MNMKNFGSLVLAAILGSGLTFTAIQWMGKDKANGVKIEYVNGATPTTQVAYKINEKGEAVPLDFTGTAEKVTKAVVHIQSTQTSGVSRDRESNDPIQQFFFGPNGPIERGPSVSSGSGVIINADGYIVTNNHVVQDADIVDVVLSDNRSFKAEVIGTDPDPNVSAGIGTWEKIGPNRFGVTFVHFLSDQGAPLGTLKVRAEITLDSKTNTFSGPFRTDVVIGGNVVQSVCGTVQARRVEVEALQACP